LSRLANRTEHSGIRLDEHLVLAEPVAEERVAEYARGHELATIERTHPEVGLSVGGSLKRRRDSPARRRPALIDEAESGVAHLGGDQDVGARAVELDDPDPEICHVRDRVCVSGPAGTERP
jgi:hypothetical protein